MPQVDIKNLKGDLKNCVRNQTYLFFLFFQTSGVTAEIRCDTEINAK